MYKEEFDYLKKMYTERLSRPFNNEEVSQLEAALRANVFADDTNEALDLSAKIALSQVETYGTDVNTLIDNILYHGNEKGAETALINASEAKLRLAAKFIDTEQYNKFEKMNLDLAQSFEDDPYNEYPSCLTEPSSYAITDLVKTLKGIQYLEQKNLIPEDYFTSPDPTKLVLLYASPEQIDFYINHGDVNQKETIFNDTVLDRMIQLSYQPDIVEKILKAGGIKTNNQPLDTLIERLTSEEEYEYGCKQGKEYIETQLQNMDLLLKYNINPSSRKDVFKKLPHNKDLAEKYPELFAKIMSHENPVARDRRTSSEENIDPLQAKLKKMKTALATRDFESNYNPKANLPKLGKTAAPETGEVRLEHKEAAQTQAEIAVKIMNAKRTQKSGK